MSVDYGDLDALGLIRAQLELRVKEVITKEIIEEQVAILTAKIKEELTPLLARVTFTSLSKYHDLMQMRDELHLRIKINNEEIQRDKS